MHLEVFDLIPQLVWITNNVGELVYLNVFWRKYTGTDSYAWTDYVHPDDLLPTFEKRQAAFASMQPFSTEYRLRNPQGQYRWFLARAIPHLDEERDEILWFGTCTDINDRIDAVAREQEAIEMAKVKARFFANMSHELRTPIHGILGFTKLLLDGNINEEQKEDLSTIKNCCQTLVSLVDDILDISKLEAGKLQLHIVPFRLLDHVHHVLKVAALRNLTLTTTFDPDLPQWVYGDEKRLTQVFTNLISNAVKFTADDGCISIEMRVVNRAGTLVHVSIVVKDTGIGIDPAVIKTLFNPFTQADSSTSRNYGGSGLGLSICKSLVNLMNGKIAVTSAPGCGSVFTVDIPFATADGIPRGVTELHTNTPVSRNISIMVAEDNLINKRILDRTLRAAGFEKVFHVENGAKAVQEFANKKFDVILMDCQMPIMDGFEATRIIRKMEEKSQRGRTRIVAVTANGMKEDIDQCLAAGMDDVLIKPFGPDILVAVLGGNSITSTDT